MYIKSVDIANFRIFYKDHHFNFSCNDKFLNVIYGKNSTGKTSLINAVHWCLYGQEILEGGAEPIINEGIVEEIPRNGEANVEVTVMFEYDERDIAVQRTINFYKNEDGKLIQGLDDFNILLDGQFVLSKEALISKRCSKQLFNLSYVNVNQSLFDKNFANDIKSVLFNYFQLDIVDIAYEHLKKSYSNFLKKSEKIDSQIIQINSYNRLKKDYDEVCLEIDNLNQRIFELNDLKEKYSFKIDSDIFKKSEFLSNDLHSLNLKIEKLGSDYSNLVLRSFPMLVLFKDASSNPVLKNYLLSLNDENSGYSYLKDLFDFKTDLINLEKVIFNISHYIKQIKDCNEELEKVYYEYESLNLYIKDMDEPLVKKVESIQKTIKYSSAEVDRLEYKKDYLKKEISRYSKKINNIQMISNEIQKKDSFYKDALDAFKYIGEGMLKEIICEISDSMNNIFLQNFKMDKKFSKVIITENFDLSIIKKSNKPIKFEDLSYSEQYVLYLSLIFSIQKIISDDVFIIVDMQFLNFDRENLKNFLSVLKCNDNQCFLLFNDSMYDDGIRFNLIDNVNIEYELINSNDKIKVIKHENSSS
nr:AAA family ATPase [uncultured Methanobrevibacter sp.]